MTVTRFPHSNHIVHVRGPCYKIPTFHIMFGGPTVIDSYKIASFHIRYVRTIRVIDCYKIHTFHIRFEGL